MVACMVRAQAHTEESHIFHCQRQLHPDVLLSVSILRFRSELRDFWNMLVAFAVGPAHSPAEDWVFEGTATRCTYGALIDAQNLPHSWTPFHGQQRLGPSAASPKGCSVHLIEREQHFPCPAPCFAFATFQLCMKTSLSASLRPICTASIPSNAGVVCRDPSHNLGLIVLDRTHNALCRNTTSFMDGENLRTLARECKICLFFVWRSCLGYKHMCKIDGPRTFLDIGGELWTGV